ncbi:E3 ubiquitin-protein ligase RFI2-like [Hibiscus syriacus]|uniref:E3 ubiquitin-protein ligase RFI2-like n=1 Tax=Hibiscus syriacus TaxID=106335 RepID=UPI001924468B|nr:E3 ubiquitin-protein ligase RFI2-like [Hibiscus syriacus]
MGLASNGGDDVAVDDGGGGAVCDGVDCGNGGKSFGSVSCSICLETVTDNGDRSWSKLHCGHQFHLDCIGSAFNIKGAMQCPNCRKIEKGQWLYANGGRSYPEFNVDDWTHDEELYDLSFSEMSFGVHWCPFGSLARFPSFEEGEFSSTTYHELLGQNAIFPEHSAPAAHPCPYVAYYGPTVHPLSSNSRSVSDSSSFNTHWNGPPVPGEVPTSYAFPAVDLHYHNWEDYSSPFSTFSDRIGSSDQPSNPPVSHRSARSSFDMPRSGSFMLPFVVGHSSGARAGSSVASSLIPPYPSSNARARDRVQALQAYYQPQHPSTSPPVRTPIISGSRRSSNHRVQAQVGPVVSSSDQMGGFYFVPPGTSAHNFLDTENPHSTRFHAWERDHLPSFSINQVDRDSGWGAFHQFAASSDPSIRSGIFCQRHGSERTSSHNHS